MVRRPWCLVILLGGAVAAAAASGPAAADRDDLARNRRLLDRWRGDPEHHARLQRDLRAFYALPPKRQEQLRKIDRDLHQGDVTRQTRLWGVLDRYASWLDKLDEADRRRVLDAETAEARLQAIREIRDRQWVDRLPEKDREALLRLPQDERPTRITRLREEDRQRRHRWRTGGAKKGEPNLRPSKTSEFTPEVRAYIDGLRLRLNAEERERLRQAEGKWPNLPRTVRELADLHPILPPLPTGPITRHSELPEEARRLLARVEKRKLKGLQRPALARWPDYALEVTRLLKSEKLTPPPLGASRPAEFSADVQAFLKDKLLPELFKSQREALAKLEGHWPDYPRQLLRLARDRGLAIPGMSLPGPPEVWENALAALPDVPDRLLMRFAHEATPEDRARWELTTADPLGGWRKVKKHYWFAAEQESRRKAKRPVAADGDGPAPDQPAVQD